MSTRSLFSRLTDWTIMIYGALAVVVTLINHFSYIPNNDSDKLVLMNYILGIGGIVCILMLILAIIFQEGRCDCEIGPTGVVLTVLLTVIVLSSTLINNKFMDIMQSTSGKKWVNLAGLSSAVTLILPGIINSVA